MSARNGTKMWLPRRPASVWVLRVPGRVLFFSKLQDAKSEAVSIWPNYYSISRYVPR